MESDLKDGNDHNSIEKDSHQASTGNTNWNWQRTVIVLNVSTVVIVLSVAAMASMMSGVSDKYQKLSDSTANINNSMTELKDRFSENVQAVQALYKFDSTRKAQFRLNKKRVLKVENNRKESADTVLYVDRRHNREPQ